MTDIVRNVSEFIDGESTRPEMVTLTLYGLNLNKFMETYDIIAELVDPESLKRAAEADDNDINESSGNGIQFLVKQNDTEGKIKTVILGLVIRSDIARSYSVKLILQKGEIINKANMSAFMMSQHSRLGALSPYMNLSLETIQDNIATHIYHNNNNTTDLSTSNPALFHEILDNLYNLEKKLIDGELRDDFTIDQLHEDYPLVFVIPKASDQIMIDNVHILFRDYIENIETTPYIFYMSIYDQNKELFEIEILFEDLDRRRIQVTVNGIGFSLLKTVNSQPFTKSSSFLYFLNSLRKKIDLKYSNTL
jgi:hypothetical protein